MLTLILALSVLGCVDPAVTKDEEFSENEKGRVRGEETPDPAAAGSDVFIRDHPRYHSLGLTPAFIVQLRPADFIYTKFSRGRALDFIYANFLREAVVPRGGRSGQKLQIFGLISFMRKIMVY